MHPGGPTGNLDLTVEFCFLFGSLSARHNIRLSLIWTAALLTPSALGGFIPIESKDKHCAAVTRSLMRVGRSAHIPRRDASEHEDGTLWS